MTRPNTARRRNDGVDADQSDFARWTRNPVAGTVLPLIASVMSVVRLATEPTKRDQQVADLFATAPKEVRDAAVAELANDDGNYSDIIARFVISDGSIDSYNSTINPRGWERADYLRNPVVLYAHDSYSGLPIGRDIGNYVDDERGTLMGTVRFVSEKMGEAEAKIGKWVAARALNAASVGFEPIEWEINEDRDDGESWFYPIDFIRQKLREWSVVPVPANANCVVDGRSLRSVGLDPVEFRRMIEEALDAADVFFLPRKALLDLKRAAGGEKLVVDLRGVGSFDVTRVLPARFEREQVEDSTVVPADAGDQNMLVCPNCDYEGPAADFQETLGEAVATDGGDLDAGGVGDNAPTAAAQSIDNRASVRQADAQEDEDAALVDMASEVVDLIESGRLPR